MVDYTKARLRRHNHTILGRQEHVLHDFMVRLDLEGYLSEAERYRLTSSLRLWLDRDISVVALHRLDERTD